MSKWMIAAKRADFKQIAERFGIDQVTARLLRNRDVVGDEAIGAWLHGGMETLHDPMRMKDMARAAEVVHACVAAGKKLRIIGDYDADGICAAFILYRGLLAHGAAAIDYVLPNRVRDGYGVSEHLIRQAKDDGVGLILTCDNGIRETASIALAKELGMTVVVTDHHECRVGEDGQMELPPADAVVDPMRADDDYPYPRICGAVVAYKFLQALYALYGAPADGEALLDELIVFAALATDCDMMPLLDENRVIVREGLKRIARERTPGFASLVRACGLRPDGVRADDFGYVLGPCLNATGRIDSAHRAMELLTCRDETAAAVIAGDLLALNNERKGLTAAGAKEAQAIIEAEGYAHDRVLVIFLPDSHESIAGIIAGRVRERYGRPTIILTEAAEEGLVKGSGRSIPQYDMYRAMSAFEDRFVRFGGHEQAVGLTLRREDIGWLRGALNDACTLTEEELEPRLKIDMEMPLSYATKELVEQFSVLEPFGKGNPEPLFAARDVRLLHGRVVGKNQDTGKYLIGDASGREYDMICFGLLDRFNDFLRERYGADGLRDIYDGYRARGAYTFHMAYYAQINSYRGQESLQFRMRDFL